VKLKLLGQTAHLALVAARIEKLGIAERFSGRIAE